MRAWSVAVAFAAAFAALSCLALRISLRNFAQARAIGAAPPLDVADLVAAVPGRRVPKRWPEPDDIDDARIAAAYRDLARDRRLTGMFHGELLLLAASAALGAAFGPAIREGGWFVMLPVVAALFGMAGIVIRTAASEKYTVVAARYERRRRELHQPPPPLAPPSLLATVGRAIGRWAESFVAGA